MKGSLTEDGMGDAAGGGRQAQDARGQQLPNDPNNPEGGEGEQRSPIYRYDRPFPVKLPKTSSFGLFLIVEMLKGLGVIVSFLLGVIVSPLILLTLATFVVVPRILVQAYIWIRFRKEGLSILPSMQSFEAGGYEFFTVVFIISGNCKIDKIRQKFQSLLNAKQGSRFKYPQLRHKLVNRMGYYCRQEVEKVNVNNHVNYLQDDSETIEVAQSQLLRLLQNDFNLGTFDKVLRTDHAPLWEALVVPRFFYDTVLGDSEDGLQTEDMSYVLEENAKFYAVAFRALSAIVDKQTALKMFKEEIVDPLDAEVDHVGSNRIAKLGRSERLLIRWYSIILTPWFILKRLVQGSPSSLGEYPSVEQQERTKANNNAYLLTATTNLNLGALQVAKNITKTTVTSIITSCVGGIARNMLLSQDKSLPSGYRFSIKQFLKRRSRFALSSSSVFTTTLLNDTYSYPLERLSDAFYCVSGTVHDFLLIESQKYTNAAMFWTAGLFPAKGIRILYKWLHSVQILMEFWDFGGPITIFNGNLVSDVFAWNAISGSWADYGVTVTTYAGRVKLNFIGRNDVLGFGSRVRQSIMSEEFLDEFENICQPCDIKPKHLYRHILLDTSVEDL